MNLPGNSLPIPNAMIRDELGKGTVIPFLGSGASLNWNSPGSSWEYNFSARLPSATELAKHLVQFSDFPAEETPELTKVAQYVHVIGGRKRLYDKLHGIFARDYAPGPIHDFLAEIEAPLLIVTTNY